VCIPRDFLAIPGQSLAYPQQGGRLSGNPGNLRDLKNTPGKPGNLQELALISGKYFYKIEKIELCAVARYKKSIEYRHGANGMKGIQSNRLNLFYLCWRRHCMLTEKKN